MNFNFSLVGFSISLAVCYVLGVWSVVKLFTTTPTNGMQLPQKVSVGCYVSGDVAHAITVEPCPPLNNLAYDKPVYNAYISRETNIFFCGSIFKISAPDPELADDGFQFFSSDVRNNSIDIQVVGFASEAYLGVPPNVKNKDRHLFYMNCNHLANLCPGVCVMDTPICAGDSDHCHEAPNIAEVNALPMVDVASIYKDLTPDNTGRMKLVGQIYKGGLNTFMTF